MTDNLPPAVAAHLAAVDADIAGLREKHRALTDFIDRRLYERAAILRTVKLMQDACSHLGTGESTATLGDERIPACRQRHDLREAVREALKIRPLPLEQLTAVVSAGVSRRVRPSEVQHALKRLGDELSFSPDGMIYLAGAPATAEGSGK